MGPIIVPPSGKMLKKIGNQPACHIHLPLLWEIHDEETSCGLRHCDSFMKMAAGGARTYNTASAVTVQSAIQSGRN